MAEINVREANDHRIVFRKVPCVIWTTGIIIMIVALYLVYHLALGSMGVLFEGYREGLWWQYLIAIAVFLFGLVFMYAGKIETIVIDRE